MEEFVPVNEPLLDGNESRYLLDCVESGWISSEGQYVTRFEQEMANRVNRKHGIAVCNGSVAIELAVQALGIGPGDEVILPSFTIISCITPILRLGAKPVLVDCDARTLNMDVTALETAISAATKAIMVVHIYGLPTDMDPVLALAEKYNLKIIEDAAEMHGQDYRGRPCGSFGDISTFSFYANKHITTGEGGMVLTNDDALAEELKSLRNLCFQPQERFVHERLGWNFRLTNLQAALGVAQLESLSRFVAKKRQMGALYDEMLAGIDGLHLPVPRTSYAENIYWVYGVMLDSDTGWTGKSMMAELGKHNIGSRPFFCPMHMQPVLQKMGLFDGLSLPHSEQAYAQGFYLPSGMALREEQMVQVVTAIKKILL